ncbi:hypothetical protein [Thiomicrorhabdus hydrogeniphila]
MFIFLSFMSRTKMALNKKEFTRLSLILATLRPLDGYMKLPGLVKAESFTCFY